MKRIMLFLVLTVSASAAPAPPDQNPPSATGTTHPLFVTSDQCMACHNGLVTPAGEDVSIGTDWSASMMANSARDPYWQAGVRREVMDHPTAQAAIENECAGCHMPMARFEAKAGGKRDGVFVHLPIGRHQERADLLAADGTSCTLCHQIQERGLGTRESFTAGFSVDTVTPLGQRKVTGPFEVDPGRMTIMRSASGFEPKQAAVVSSSEMCATCHTLYTHTLGPNGEVLGELPEQVPYLEWRHSTYRDQRSCQSCHLPVVPEKMPVSSVLGEMREGFSQHSFRGGNFFMPKVFNRYRDELGVTAQSQDLDSASRRTLAHLETDAARLVLERSIIEQGRLEAVVAIENLAGHKLPTAYPSRRAWVHFKVSDADGKTVFESGGFRPDGAISGNDNDVDPLRYEPHYSRIEEADQVQIYEAILVDAGGSVTTGLLTGLRYAKDNRILPLGFDAATAHQDIAPRGRVTEDADFVGGSDRIQYVVRLGGLKGPYRLEAELWYQPIGYRWARNLAAVKSFETDRFVSYFEAMGSASGAVLARDSKTVD